VPVVISAWFLSIPIIIHEQTLVSGLANEISAFFANKVAISFKGDQIRKDRRMVFTGNPMRKAILESYENRSRDKVTALSPDITQIVKISQKEKKPLIYITGGNQGSHLINEAIRQILEDLTKVACIVHQTGDSKFNDFDKMTSKQKSLSHPQRYLVKKWLEVEDLAELLKKVDLVISRGGINILYELAYFSIPTLVIPIPYLYKDEQTTNACYFGKLGLAQVLWQVDLTAEKLYQTVAKMLKNLPQLKKQAQNAHPIAIADAAKRLALETLLLGDRESHLR